MKTTKAFTLAEILVSVALFVLIGGIIAIFGRNIFSINFSLQNELTAELDGHKVLKQLVAEVRSAVPSAVGSYPIESAATSSFVFYSNIDANSSIERVRYFLQGTTLMKGVTDPSGSPLSYNLANEKVSTVVNTVVNGTSTPIFDYFDGSYAGTTSPLTQPVDVSKIRLVRATVIIDADPNRSPQRITITTLGTLRNLKDNY